MKKSAELALRKEGYDTNFEELKSPLIILQKQIQSDPKLPLTVSEELVNPDALIEETKRTLAEIERYNNRRSYNSNRPRPIGKKLNIYVSDENLPRAFRLMDAIIKLFRARGHNVMLEKDGTFVCVDGENLEIRLREKKKRVEVNPESEYEWNRFGYQLSGVFCFSIEGQYSYDNIEWSDGKQKIEEILYKILAKAELESKRRKEYQAELERGWAKQAEERRIEKEIQERKEKELAKFKRLYENARRLYQTKIMRNYINDVEAKSIQSNPNSEEVKNWLEWARKKADWFDPLIEAEDELLADIEKDELFED